MIPLSSKNQPCRRTDGHDHVLPKASSAAASSLSRSNKITSEPTTSLQTATRTCSRRPSTHSPRPSPQRAGRGLDHKYGVAETSPFREERRRGDRVKRRACVSAHQNVVLCKE